MRWPLLALLIDNPFFWREARRFRRSLPGLLGPLIVAIAAMSLWCLVVQVAGPRLVRGLPLSSVPYLACGLAVPHALACLAATTASGGMIRELSESDLSALRCLPRSPVRTLMEWLAFPCAWMATAWAAGLPVYICSALMGQAPVALLSSTALVPGALGITALVMAPFGTTAHQIRENRRKRQLLELDETAATAGIQPPLTGLALALWLTLGMGRVPFFTGWMSATTFWATVLSAHAAAEWSALLVLLSPSARASARHRRTLAGTGLFTVVLLVGVAWPRSAGVRWLVLVVAGVLTALVLRNLFSPEPGHRLREDRLGRREARWLERRSDNPLFVRDLRGRVSRYSIRRTCLLACLIYGSVAMGLLTIYRAGGVFTGPPDPILVAIAAVASGAGFLVAVFIEPILQWRKEAEMGTLPGLLNSPQPTSSLLYGRAMAGLCCAGGSNLALLLISLGLLLWLSRLGYPLVLPAVASALVLPSALFLTLGPGKPPERTMERRMIYVAFTIAGIAAWLASCGHDTGLLPAGCGLLLLGTLTAVAGRAYVAYRIQALDRLRGIGSPDS